jgi:hypothetical protein
VPQPSSSPLTCEGVPHPSSSPVTRGGVPQPSASPFCRPWLSGLSHSSSPAEERLSQTSDIARTGVFLSISYYQYRFRARDFDCKSIKRCCLEMSLLWDG